MERLDDGVQSMMPGDSTGPLAGSIIASPGADWGDESLDPTTLARMARALTASGRYQVVERFERRATYREPALDADVRRALLVDVETTGLDPTSDAIIQLAAVPFTYDRRDGRIYHVDSCVSYLEDPKCSIPAAVTRLTGITDADVYGRRIDDGVVNELAARTHLVIAHKASFDRAFVERRLPAFEDKHWACSLSEVPWSDEGFVSPKLEWLAYQHGRMFYEAHRADSDCYMTIHLLATPLPSGRLPLDLLLDCSRKRSVAFWAVGAPFEKKDRLKARRYQFNAGDDGRPKAWWREVSRADARDEASWLTANVYDGWVTPGYQWVEISARNRHSSRAAPSVA